MYLEGIGGLFINRLKPIIFKDKTGINLPDNTEIQDIGIQLNRESASLYNIDFDELDRLNIVADYFIKGYWVPILVEYDDEGKAEEVESYNAFIVDLENGMSNLFISGVYLGKNISEDIDAINVLRPAMINHFSDKLKQVIYYIVQ